MHLKATQWVLAVLVVLWSFGSVLQAQESEACSYLWDQVNGYPVCTSSTIDLAVVNKIDLKGRIGGQHISDISSVRFESNEAIIEVDLSDNPRLTELPVFILDFPNLVHLDISNTGISDFDERICQLKKLEKLIGRNNSYKDNEIPFHTFCLENLKILDMSNSYIRYIDEYIGKLKSLREVLLRNHQLTALPLMLYELSQLEEVDLRSYLSSTSKLDLLLSCKGVVGEDQVSCKESLLDEVRCAYYKEIPFERGDGSFRKIYADMAGLSLEVFENPNNSDLVDNVPNSPDNPRLLLTDKCYIIWLGGIDYEGESSYLLEKTIGGRTIRELRYIHGIWYGHDTWYSGVTRNSAVVDVLTSIFTLGMADADICGFNFAIEGRTKLPFWSLEIFPERYLRGGVSVSVRNGLSSKYLGIYEEDWWVPQYCSHIPDFEERIEKIRKEADWSWQDFWEYLRGLVM